MSLEWLKSNYPGEYAAFLECGDTEGPVDDGYAEGEIIDAMNEIREFLPCSFHEGGLTNNGWGCVDDLRHDVEFYVRLLSPDYQIDWARQRITVTRGHRDLVYQALVALGLRVKTLSDGVLRFDDAFSRSSVDRRDIVWRLCPLVRHPEADTPGSNGQDEVRVHRRHAVQR